jgi:hypothetical protein
MDDNDIPDLSSATTGEICTVLLVVVALAMAVNSLGFSLSDPLRGYATLAITVGLAAIAFAILTVGRNLSRSD